MFRAMCRVNTDTDFENENEGYNMTVPPFDEENDGCDDSMMDGTLVMAPVVLEFAHSSLPLFRQLMVQETAMNLYSISNNTMV